TPGNGARGMARAGDKHNRGRPAGRGRRRGQSMVELALMMPLLALIMVGTLDMGRMFFYYTRLSDAVKEGALFGMRTPAALAPSSSTCYTSEFQNVDPDNVLYHVRQARSEERRVGKEMRSRVRDAYY